MDGLRACRDWLPIDDVQKLFPLLVARSPGHEGHRHRIIARPVATVHRHRCARMRDLGARRGFVCVRACVCVYWWWGSLQLCILGLELVVLLECPLHDCCICARLRRPRSPHPQRRLCSRCRGRSGNRSGCWCRSNTGGRLHRPCLGHLQVLESRLHGDPVGRGILAHARLQNIGNNQLRLPSAQLAAPALPPSLLFRFMSKSSART